MSPLAAAAKLLSPTQCAGDARICIDHIAPPPVIARTNAAGLAVKSPCSCDVPPEQGPVQEWNEEGSPPPTSAPGSNSTEPSVPPISADIAGLWAVLVIHARTAISIVDAMGLYRYLSPRLLELTGKDASEFLGRSVEQIMAGPAGAERLALVRQAITAAKPLLLVESLNGVPFRTIIERTTAPSGEYLALCIHHVGAAAMELPLDTARYTIITPESHEITPLSRLTEREIEVLRLIAMGDSQAEIASKIHRTVKTVEWHRASIGKKLGATSRVELARLAIRYGLVNTEAAAGTPRMAVSHDEPSTD